MSKVIYGNEAVQESPKGSQVASLRKMDSKQQIVWGEVFAPGFPDSQGDFMSPDTVRTMAYGFMRKMALDNIDTNHTREKNGSYVVEFFIARDDDPTFIPGSWVLGVHVPDGAVWEQVEKGELNGFSLDGIGVRVDAEFEVELPDVLQGMTEAAEDGHVHSFIVKFDEEGNFLGGETDEGPDGHYHKIVAGTCTETSSGHSHRFSFVEGVLHAQTVN